MARETEPSIRSLVEERELAEADWRVSDILRSGDGSDSLWVPCMTKAGVGLVTPTELLKAGSLNSKLASFCSRAPKLSPSYSVREAAKVMVQQRLRLLPIFEENRYIGVIKAETILRSIYHSVSAIRLSAIMTSDVNSVSRSDTLLKVLSIMTKFKQEHVPVVQGQSLISVLRAVDLVTAVMQPVENVTKGGLDGTRPKSLTVGKIELPEPLTVDVTIDYGSAFRKMISANLDYVAVSFSNEFHGLATIVDFLKPLTTPSFSEPVSVFVSGLDTSTVDYSLAEARLVHLQKRLSERLPRDVKLNAKVKRLGPRATRYSVDLYISAGAKTWNLTEEGFDLHQLLRNLELKAYRAVSFKKQLKRKPRALLE
ncbi:MAG: CBS domain-containing protein [Thermoprotei archaeon]